jgi:hypothetical protein
MSYKKLSFTMRCEATHYKDQRSVRDKGGSKETNYEEGYCKLRRFGGR